MDTKILTSSIHCFENECKEIHESWGTLNQLVRSLAGRSKLERQQIRETYKAMYGEDMTILLQKMQTQIGSKVCEALFMWMIDAHERDAIVAKEAFGQGDANYKALVEIFVGRKSSHIVLMKQAYYARFRRHLDQEIINLEPTHPYRKPIHPYRKVSFFKVKDYQILNFGFNNGATVLKILVALAASHKAHQEDVSQHIAKCDARRLYEAGEWSSQGAIEEAVVLEILSKRSIPQMRLTLSSYKHIYGHEYTKSLKRVVNYMEFEDALKTVIECMCYPPKYYAKLLYTSIKGTTADKGALARVMISRAEVDLDEIKRVFKKKYEMELKDAICESIPSGDFRDFLAALASTTTIITS